MAKAFLDPSLASYERFWFVEYDADFSGDWGALCGRPATIPEQSSAQTSSHAAAATYFHWPTYRHPPHAITEPVRGFFPVSRFSREVLSVIRDEIERHQWEGHFEILYPTIAVTRGFDVFDIGGSGSMVPPEWLNRHYRLGERTWLYRPPRSSAYFGDARNPFDGQTGSTIQ